MSDEHTFDASNWHERPQVFEVGPAHASAFDSLDGDQLGVQTYRVATLADVASPSLNFTALALVASELARLLGRYLAGENDMGDDGDAATWLDEFDRLRAAIIREAVAS